MEAVDKLTFDATGAQKGAREITAAGEQIIAASKKIERVFSPIADAAERASRRIVTGTSEQAKFLDSLIRKYDPLTQAVRQAERDFNRLSGIMSSGGEHAARAAAQIGAVSRRLQDAQRAAASVGLDNAFKGIGRAAEEAARQSNVAWANMGAAVGAAARLAAKEADTAWKNLATGVGAAAQQAARQSDQAWAHMARGLGEAAREAQSVRSRFNSIAASLDPAIANTQRLAAVERDLDRAVAAGVTTARERNRLLSEAVRLSSGSTSGGAGGLSAAQRAALPGQLQFQINDIVGGLMTGQRPMTVLLQQGPQVAQILGGWGAAFRALASPIGLAVAGLAALAVSVGAVIARAASLESASRQIGVSLRTMGGAAGLSVAGVQDIIDQQSRQPGFGRSETTAAARQVLDNRNIRGGDVADTLSLARELALVNGQELSQALDALLPKLTSGAAGVRQLDDAYGILTAEQLRYIDTLERQGRQQEITRIGIDAMTARFKGEGARSMSEFGRAADDAGKAFGHLLDRIGRSDAVRGHIATWATAAKLFRDAVGPAAVSDPRAALQATLDEAQRRYSVSVQQFGPRNRQLPELQKELDAAKAAVDRFDAAAFTREVDEIIAAAIRMGAAVEDDRKKLNALIDRVDPFRVEVRNATSDLAALAEQLPKAFGSNQARQMLDEFTARLDPFAKKLREIKDATADLSIPTEFGRALAEVDRRYQRDAAAKGLLGPDGAILDPKLYDARNAEIQARTDFNVAGLALETDQAQFAANLERSRAAAIGNARALAELSAQQGIYNALLKFGTVAELDAFLQKGEIAEKFKLLAQALRESAQAGVTGQVEDRFKQLDKEAKSLGDVTAAYLKNTAAGRDAEIMHRAWMETADDDTEAYKRLTAALYAVDEAQRHVEGAKLIAQTRDDLRYETMLVDALRQGVDAYDRTTTAVRVLKEVEQGRFKEGSAEAEAYRQALAGLQAQEARRQAIDLERQHNPRAAFRQEIENLEKLARTGEISAQTYQRVWEEAYIRAATASDSWTDGAIAGLMEYARTAERIGGEVASIMVRAFSTIEDSIARMLFGMKVDAKTILQEIGVDIARLAVRQTITAPIAGFLGSLFGGGGSAQMGGGTGGASGGGVRFDANGMPMAGGGGGFNPLSMFGGGGFGGGSGWLGGIGTWLNTPIGFNPLPAGMTYGPLAPAANGLAGSWLGGITPMQGLGALAGAGMGIYNLTQGNTIGGIGGILGAGVSLIPGMQWAGPIIGIASSILGSLFKKKPEFRAQGFHDYDAAAGGYVGRVGYEMNMKAPLAPEIGDDALKLLGAFGGRVAEGRSAPGYYLWRGYEDGRMDATLTAEGSPEYRRLLEKVQNDGIAKGTDEIQWAARTELWTDAPVNGRWAQLPINALSTDTDKLMQQLALLIMKAAVREGSITGLSATSQKIVRNFPDADTQGLAEALQWGKSTYDVLVRPDVMTNAEKALTDLKDSFQAAIMKAEEYRLATDGLVVAQDRAVKKVATDFNQSIGDRILGITDPAALQRLQLDREFDALRKEAEYLNSDAVRALTGTLVDINELERLYGLQREQIVSQQLNGLLDLQKRLLFGDLSGATPAMTVAGTHASFQATLAQASAGSADALGRLSGVGADYVSSLQAAYGHTERYVSGRDEVLAAIARFTNPTGNGVTGTTAANDITSSVVALQSLINRQAEQIGTLTSQVSAVMQQNAILIAELQRTRQVA